MSTNSTPEVIRPTEVRNPGGPVRSLSSWADQEAQTGFEMPATTSTRIEDLREDKRAGTPAVALVDWHGYSIY